MEGLSAYENGGKGSGNWGHAGRPGEVGGSAPQGSTSASWRDLPDDAETLEFDSIEKVYLEDRGGWPAYKKKLYDKYSTRYPDKKIVVRRTRMETKGLLEYAVFGLKKDGEQKEKELKEEIKVKSKEYDQLFDKLLDASKDANNKNVSAIKKLIRQFDDNTKIWNLEPEDQPAEYDRRVKEIKKILAESKKPKSEGLSLRGKSLYEKVHMIEPGDEVHIKPNKRLPNFPKEIKVDYVEDGTIHYGASETSDGYTYPAWAIDDITKIIRK